MRHLSAAHYRPGDRFFDTARALNHAGSHIIFGREHDRRRDSNNHAGKPHHELAHDRRLCWAKIDAQSQKRRTEC
jgi:hypothetical protein